MGGLEDGHPGVVVDVPARGYPDTAHLSGKGIRYVVTIEVGGCYHVVVGGTGEYLLEHRVSYDVLDEEFVAGIAAAVLPGHGSVGELVLHDLVPPGSKGALGELHDVALVDKGHRLAVIRQSELDSCTDKTLRSGDRHRFETKSRVGTDLPAELVLYELEQLLRLVGTLLELLPRINILGVLPEDHHVNQTRVLHWRGHPVEPAHRANTCVEIEYLAKGNVQRSDATTNGRGQRTLDPNQVLAKCVDSLVGKPRPGLVVCLLTGQDLLPGNAAPAVISLLDRSIEDPDGGGPYVGTDAVALYEGDDWVVRDVETVRSHGDWSTHGQRLLRETNRRPGD